MIAFTNFAGNVVTFTALSVIGMVAAIYSIRHTLKDRKVVRTLAQDALTRKALGEEGGRLYMHLTFILVGVTAMFISPMSHQRIRQDVIQWLFIAGPGVLALSSLYAIRMRRKLRSILERKDQP